MGNNKGFSLIELLIALAIGAVIVLMTSFMLIQGSTFFNKESDDVNMRNDYQVVRNQLEQAIMEAKTVVITRATNTGDIVIYTGAVDTASNKLLVEKEGGQTTERIITYVKADGKIYISSNYASATNDGSLLCSEVTHFDIEFEPLCKKEVEEKTGTVTYYTNPLQINMDLDLKINDSKMSSVMSVKVRNVLREVAEYTMTNRGTLLMNATETKYGVR